MYKRHAKREKVFILLKKLNKIINTQYKFLFIFLFYCQTILKQNFYTVTDPKNIKTTNESTSALNKTVTKTNATTTNSDNVLPINSPGVVKRGLIVFGGFAILAVAYFIFYRYLFLFLTGFMLYTLCKNLHIYLDLILI